MTILIKLTEAGSDTGPFSLYTDYDNFTTPIATDVSKSSMLTGYTTVVNDSTSIVKISSTGRCINSKTIRVVETTTTTTSTSSSTTTTTSTTSPVVHQITGEYGTQTCIGGIMGINSQGATGYMYYKTPVIQVNTVLYTDSMCTTPLPPEYSFIRKNGTSPQLLLDVTDGQVILIYNVGDPC